MNFFKEKAKHNTTMRKSLRDAAHFTNKILLEI